MEDINHLLDLPSPSNSYQYMYGDAEQYLDTTTSEEGQSSVNSPYDLSYPGEFPGSNSYPSPDRESGSQSPRPATAQAKAPAKRKRENRYKNAPPSVLSRRRAQNRASQRAYRERKDQRIKDLEQMLNDAKSRNDVLSQAYAELHAEYVKLKTSQLSEAQQYPAEIQFDPTIGMTNNNDRLDMDMYVYSDMNNYSLS